MRAVGVRLHGRSEATRQALTRRALGRLGCVLGAGAMLGGCAIPPPAPGCGAVSLWLLNRGWHTEFAIATDAIEGGLQTFVPRFPGARLLLFGYGKRSFMTATVQRFQELLIGPFPGDGVIQVTAISATPAPPAIGLAFDAQALRALTDFIWSTVDRDETGGPRLLGARDGAVFYASPRRYSLDYTCNTWSAEALAQAGLPVAVDGVRVVSELLRQVTTLPQACRVS